MTFVNEMRLSWFVVCALSAALAGCGVTTGTGITPSGINAGVSMNAITGNNVLPLTVNGALCSSGSYTDKPCVNVTICSPGTNICQTVSDILLDSGSYGLRLFKSVLSVPVTQMTSGGMDVGECVSFGDGTSDWGGVAQADVVLGGESPVTVPIQVIDSTFYSGEYSCGSSPDAGPSDAGFNGILGVGLLGEDCGTLCAAKTNNHQYYACNGTSCSGTTVGLANQVQNPISLLPVDNDGLIIELPGVPPGGVAYANGYVVLGIATQSNNTVPQGVVKYTADPSTGDFSTSYDSSTMTAFLDTGSNGIFFPGNLTECDSQASGFYCPSSLTSLNAKIISSTGVQYADAFVIGNMDDLINTGNTVFVESGGPSGGGLSSEFDWGLPFFLGRSVYVGISGMNAPGLGVGPYWAF